VKQVYPPPGSEAEPPLDDGPKPMPFASRRSPRGPMMRQPDAEPPPKGKVRQLYPPPEFDEEYVEEGSSPPPAAQPRDPQLDSMFVSDEAELERRRRSARERAEARRGGEVDGDESPAIRPPFGGSFDDFEA